MDNDVLALTYGRPGIQVAFSSDGAGKRWDVIETIVPHGFRRSYGVYDVTSGKPGFVPIGAGRFLLLYDVYAYAARPGAPRLNTVFARDIHLRRGRGGGEGGPS